MSTINYSELYYDRPKGRYIYPSWAVGIGWTMAAFAAVWIPVGWVFHIVRYGKDMEVRICIMHVISEKVPYC